MRTVVGREKIPFVEIFHTDAIALRNAIHRFAGLYSVERFSDGLGHMFLFLFQINNVSFFQSIVFVDLVVFSQTRSPHIHCFGNRLESVSAFGDKIDEIVADIETMVEGFGTIDL